MPSVATTPNRPSMPFMRPPGATAQLEFSFTEGPDLPWEGAPPAPVAVPKSPEPDAPPVPAADVATASADAAVDVAADAEVLAELPLPHSWEHSFEHTMQMHWMSCE